MKRVQSQDVPARPGLRERRKRATRGELIQAGRSLFSKRGLYEARIEDLSATAGIAKGTLYSYFANKEELIRAVASTGFTELEALVSSRSRPARSERDLFRRAIRAHFQFFAANPDMMRVFHQVRGMLKFDRPEWRPLRTALVAYLEGFARLLAGSPRVREMRRRDRLVLAGALFGAISGVTSVTASTDGSAVKSRPDEALVQGLVAMATEYVSMRERR